MSKKYEELYKLCVHITSYREINHNTSTVASVINALTFLVEELSVEE